MKLVQSDKKKVKEINLLRTQGKKIVLCHGAFDLVHPGHMDHLQSAKLLGDILIVTITADKFIRKSIHNPFFDEDTRSNYLKNIKIIDYVFTVNASNAVPAIKLFKPHYYCKGIEYKNSDGIGNLDTEKKALNQVNGKLKYLGHNVQSSSNFISKNLFKFNDKIITSNLKKISYKEVKNTINKISKLKVLIIGEAIIDQYTYVVTKGVSPKSSTLSCIEKSKQIMPGGVLATYKFLSSIAKSTKLITLVNSELNEDPKYKKLLKFKSDKIVSKNYTKIIKNRIIEKDEENKKIKKILTLNNYQEKNITKEEENLILKKLNKILPNTDIVIAQDFGHNFFTKKIVDLLQKKSQKLSVNIQANSLNYGFNIIGKKFNHADIFSLDEKELELFCAKKNVNHLEELKKLAKHLSAEKGFLTCGDRFSLGVDGGRNITIPTLNKNAIDPVGAGDIFHSLASLLSCVSKNMFLTLFLSQIAGAHSVSIVGNSEYPKMNQILKTFNFYKNSIEN